ncbi:MAG: hypothetical protein Q7R35_03710 [Elusimicrobiota bacterium]|nr:hypothetical protein [Elusimicrobiota bacterium]
MRLLLSVLLLCCALPAGAQNLPDLPDLGDLPEPTRYLAGYVSGGYGWSLPFGGHWGDRDAGFKPSPAFSLAASRRFDETLSYGVESFYGWSHKHRVSRGLELKLFSLTPFLKASAPAGDKVYYGILGAGVYQWKQPAYTSGGLRHGSDSGSSGGINLGGGVSYSFLWETRACLDLRWHHIFNMKGASLSLNSVDSFNIMFVVTYGVWKDKKKP